MLVCHHNNVCEDSIGSVYVGRYCGLTESKLHVFCKLCPVCFLVVCEYMVVLLQSCCMLIVAMMDRWSDDSHYCMLSPRLYGLLDTVVIMFVVVWCLALWLVCLCCPLWSSVYECQRVKCACTFPVRAECGMILMGCMQCCMSVSTVL